MSKEFSGQKACIAPEGVFIIGTYDENGVPNAMNAAWGVQSDYGEITLFLAPHKTTDNVKKTKAFTVAFATKDTVEIADYCRASSIYITINHLLKSGYKDTSLTLAFSLVNSQ